VAIASAQIEGRERILREARALFLERGFAEASMQDIAAAAGLTKAALYHHFRDKNELFDTIVQRELTRVTRGLDREFGEDTPLREGLVRAGAFLIASMDGDLPRLLLDAFKHVYAGDPEAIARCRAGAVERPIEESIARAQRAGDVRKDLEASLLASLWAGMIFEQYRATLIERGAEHEAPALAEVIADVFLNGVSKGSA
jgi:AcrR family transcriptional regulator